MNYPVNVDDDQPATPRLYSRAVPPSYFVGTPVARGDVKSDDNPPPGAGVMTSTPVQRSPAVGKVVGQGGGAKGKLFKAKNVMPGTEKGGDGKGCQYLKGGTCMTHGPGAKLKHKPVMTTTRGRDGKTHREMKRHYFYVCNVGPAWQTGMAKFLMSAKKSGGTVSDATRGNVGGGGARSDFSSSMCTVGQTETSEDRNVADELEPVLDDV